MTNNTCPTCGYNRKKQKRIILSLITQLDNALEKLNQVENFAHKIRDRHAGLAKVDIANNLEMILDGILPKHEELISKHCGTW